MAGSASGELLIIVLLVLANGFFAAAEIAILAARRGRLQQLADSGDHSARLALDLANNPDRFLPTVQVGISLVGTFAAVFGGARLVSLLGEALKPAPIPWVAAHSDRIAIGAVVVFITVLSVILGELVPKRLALRHATELSRFVAWPILVIARVTQPAVVCLRFVTEMILKLLRSSGAPHAAVSIEDIRHLIQMGTEAGVLEPVEQKVALEALSLGDRSVRSIMRPRIDIDAIDVHTPPREVLGTLAMAGFSRVPVYENDLDHIVGYIHLKDVVRQQYLGWPIDIRKLMRPPLFVPATLSIDRLLMRFRERNEQVAIILDEFGGTEGMVTLEDVLEELVGELVVGQQFDHDQEFVRRDEHSWLIDGRADIADLVHRLSVRTVEADARRPFTTVAGLVLAQLGRIPSIGDKTNWEGLDIEVVDMDGPRIDRVLVSTPGATPEATNGAPP